MEQHEKKNLGLLYPIVKRYVTRLQTESRKAHIFKRANVIHGICSLLQVEELCSV